MGRARSRVARVRPSWLDASVGRLRHPLAAFDGRSRHRRRGTPRASERAFRDPREGAAARVPNARAAVAPRQVSRRARLFVKRRPQTRPKRRAVRCGARGDARGGGREARAGHSAGTQRRVENGANEVVTDLSRVSGRRDDLSGVANVVRSITTFASRAPKKDALSARARDPFASRGRFLFYAPCLGPATKYCLIAPMGEVPSIRGLVSGIAATVS